MTDQTPIGELLRASVPRHQAPPELRRWAEEQARAMGADAVEVEPLSNSTVRTTLRRRSTFRPLGIAAALLFAAAMGWAGRGIATRSASDQLGTPLAAELVDSHVRSLMLDHLVDVRSSDRHTVKPWFLGKAELAPKVPELADAGFPLIGGRMDFVGGRATPVIIYQRRKHFISLYLTRSADNATAAPSLTTDRGFNVLAWSEGGIAYRAVSDVAAADLKEFREVYAAAQ